MFDTLVGIGGIVMIYIEMYFSPSSHVDFSMLNRNDLKKYPFPKEIPIGSYRIKENEDISCFISFFNMNSYELALNHLQKLTMQNSKEES